MGLPQATHALPPNHFYRRGAHGFVELVDAETGVVVAVQDSPHPIPTADFVETTVNGKTLLVKGVPDRELHKMRFHHPYSKVLADLVVQKILEGTPFSKIPNEPGMPDYFTLSRWRRDHPDFEDEIRFARKMRAERLRDEALAEAELASGIAGEFVAGHKLKVDALKWAAEKDSPDEYGSKVAVSGNIGVTQLIVETGIRRAGDPGFKEVHTSPPGAGEGGRALPGETLDTIDGELVGVVERVEKVGQDASGGEGEKLADLVDTNSHSDRDG